MRVCNSFSRSLQVSIEVHVIARLTSKLIYITYLPETALCHSRFRIASRMLSNEVTVRPASPDDISSINAIHRHYVENTVITFSTEPNSDEAALDNYKNLVTQQGLPYIVAEDNASKAIFGYSYVSPFRGVKPGYRHTLELSLVCHPDLVRKGVGKQLLQRIIDILEDPAKWTDWFEGTRLLDFKPQQLIACMAVDIEGPGNGLKLRDWYLQFGFEERGHLKQVGWKQERWIDTMYLQLALAGAGQ